MSKECKIKRNQVVVWDHIMPRKSLRDFHVSKKFFKYPLVDKMSSLKDREVTVTLWIEFIPVFGWIHRVSLKETCQLMED